MEEVKNGVSIKTHVTIEVDRNGKVYRFSIPAGAPFGESFDAAFEALDIISTWQKKAKENAKDIKPADDNNEEKEVLKD